MTETSLSLDKQQAMPRAAMEVFETALDRLCGQFESRLTKRNFHSKKVSFA
jgi:hypothetical protein